MNQNKKTIDNKDIRLIRELQSNGRASNTEIAAKTGISPLTAAKRIKRLLSNNIISIRALPNPYKLGLSANALIAVKANPSKIGHIYDRLSENYYINNFSVIFGRYDIMLIVYFPTWDLLHDFINEDLSGIEGVLEIEPFYVKDIKKRYHVVSAEDSVYAKPKKLKDVDQIIIKALAEDGRMGINALSLESGIHASTISRRIAAMVEENVIRIAAVPNPAAIGFSSGAHIVIEVTANEIDRICNELVQCKEIHLVMTLVKGNGIIVGIHSVDNETLYELIQKRISHIPGIKSTETFLRAKLYKHYSGTFLELMGI